MKKFTRRGFTLIELLVVIAVIGILSSIVLVSLSGARDRAKDARVTGAMDQVRTQSIIFFDINSTYTGLDADPGIVALAADVASPTVGETFTMYIDTDAAPGENFCAVATLASGGFWCVDSDYKSEKDANGTAVSCVAGCEAAGTCACD